MPEQTAAALISYADVIRAYITSYSMPTQGPVSGATHWVTRAEALKALELLEKEYVRADA